MKTKAEMKLVNRVYSKFRQGKTLTGDESALLIEYEAWQDEFARAFAKPVRSIMDLPVARAMWAADQRDFGS